MYVGLLYELDADHHHVRNAMTYTHGKYLAIVCKYESSPLTKKAPAH